MGGEGRGCGAEPELTLGLRPCWRRSCRCVVLVPVVYSFALMGTAALTFACACATCLMMSSTTDGSASVDVSPRLDGSVLPRTMLRRRRLKQTDTSAQFERTRESEVR